MNHADTKKLFGKHYLGSDELASVPALGIARMDAPAIPFSDDALNRSANTHILLFAPKAFADGTPVTINAFRDRFGTDPSVSEPCLYSQDWYLKEEFASVTTPDNGWHLIRKNVVEEGRAKHPDEIESTFRDEAFPSAVICTLAFFAYWFTTDGERLWKHDYVWCRDRDHNGDRIYVGRYEDPTGVNKNGFEIHRHLAIRPSYSAAPEIMP